MSNYNYLRKNNLKKVFRFNMVAILLILFLHDCATPRKFKKHFPEGNFQQNNHILIYSAVSLQASILLHAKICKFMLISWKMTCPFHFFPSKKHNHAQINVTITKNNGGKIALKSSIILKTLSLGPKGPP